MRASQFRVFFLCWFCLHNKLLFFNFEKIECGFFLACVETFYGIATKTKWERDVRLLDLVLACISRWFFALSGVRNRKVRRNITLNIIFRSIENAKVTHSLFLFLEWNLL